jgi:O-antigen ligase
LVPLQKTLRNTPASSATRSGVVNRPQFAENTAIGLLCVAAILGPIALGSATPWARFALEAVMTIVVVIWGATERRTWQYTLLPVFISGLAIIQLLPLPDSLLVALAPVSAGAWKVANQGNPSAWGTISVDPAATASAARRMLLGLATVAVVGDLARYLVHRRRLIAAISVAAIVIWLLATIFPVGKDQVMLGFINLKGDIHFSRTPVNPPMATSGVGYLTEVTVGDRKYEAVDGQVGNGFGPYIYSNHFAGGLCLTLPVAIAAGLYYSRGRVPNGLRYGGAAILLAAGLWTIAVPAQSRAGTGAMILAGLVLFNLTAVRPWVRRIAEITTIGCIAALLGLMVLMYGPFEDVDQSVFGRLPKPIAQMLQGGREAPTRVAYRMFRASPLLGTGLDTYGDIFPRFQGGNVTLFYAHNDYAQLIAETGAVGGCIAAFLAGVLLMRGNRFYRNIPPASRLLEAGPWAGLAGIAAHSAFDWNLHLPANAFLASLIAGIAAATGMIKSPVGEEGKAVAKAGLVKAPATHRPASRASRGLPRLALALACAGSLVLLARDTVSDMTLRQLREAIVTARMADSNSKLTRNDEQLTSAVAAGERMARLDPANAQLALLLGQGNLHLSSRPQPIEDHNARALASEKWFKHARERCAACRGIAEPLLSAMAQ